MSGERDTPETDAVVVSAEVHGFSEFREGWFVTAEFARNLERQRDEALEVAECWDKKMDESDWCRQYREACEKIAVMHETDAALRATLAQAVEAMEQIHAHCRDPRTMPDKLLLSIAIIASDQLAACRDTKGGGA